METVNASIKACPRCPGTEGHGEGLMYGGDDYYYREGKEIPKTKAASLRNESNFLGRVHGEVNHVIVAWNGKNFSVRARYFETDRRAVSENMGHKCPCPLRHDHGKRGKQRGARNGGGGA